MTDYLYNYLFFALLRAIQDQKNINYVLLGLNYCVKIDILDLRSLIIQYELLFTGTAKPMILVKPTTCFTMHGKRFVCSRALDL